jgi:hypothetical protein
VTRAEWKESFLFQSGIARDQAFDPFAHERDFNLFILANHFAGDDDPIAKGRVMDFVARAELRLADGEGPLCVANGGWLATR